MTESFSTRLNDAMALRELKQIDFVHAAEKFNIKLGKSHMGQYVSGKTVPRADIAHFLAAYLRVNEDWLMGKDVPMEEHAAILPDFAGEQPDHVNDASEQPTEGTTMRTFTKSTKLDNVLYDVRGPVVDEAARMEDAGSTSSSSISATRHRSASAHPMRSSTTCRQQLPDTEGYSNVARACSPRARRSCSMRSSRACPTFTSRHLHGQRRVRAHQPVVDRAARQRRRGSGAQPRLSAVDGLRNPGRRSSPCITCAMRSPNGIRTSRTCAVQDHRARPRRSSSSTRTTPPALCLSEGGAPADRRSCARSTS